MARKAYRLFCGRPVQILLLAIFVLNPVFFSEAHAAQMNDYCDVPPYVVQNVVPNIMILLDNSGSMWDYAYYDSGNDCSDYDNPCTGFDPTKEYYGYFDSNTWYQYGSNRFYSYETKSQSRANPDNAYWDGNFLNWLAMRRLDVIKAALTGGLCDGGQGCTGNSDGGGSGYDRLVGVGLPSTGYGAYKQISNAPDYVPSKYTGVFQAAVTGGNSSGAFYAWNGSNWDTFNVKVRVPVPVEGVLQLVVGARARVGLASYGNPWNQPPGYTGNGDGGIVLDPIPSTSLPSLIKDINNTAPSANTPIAEALFTVAGYFAQTKEPFSTSDNPPYSFNFGEPGPYDYSGESPQYSVNDAGKDPYNYGTGGQTSYPPCAQNFVLLVTDGEPCEDGALPPSLLDYAQGKSPFVCSNSGSLDSWPDGMTGSCPAVCTNGYPPSHYSGGQCPSGSFPAEASFQSCPAGNAAAGIEDVALWMHTADLRPDLTGGPHTLTLYTVFAFGHGSTLLKYASINGGFQDINGDNEPTPGWPYEWSSDGSGNPDNYFEASQGSDMVAELTNAFSGMLKRASSGTAASILAPSQGSGANLVQAVFYPKRNFINNVIAWTGTVQNLWYYVDPFFYNSSIMEDTDRDKYLTLGQGEDDDLTFYFNTSLGRTMINRYYSNTNGLVGTRQDTATGSPDYFENVRGLWEAGLNLWETAPSGRHIYTTNVTTGQGLISFGTGNDGTIGPYLNTSGITNGTDSVIQWTEGDDLTGYDPDGDGIADYRSRTASEVVNGTESSNVWKLGDVVDSTPQIASWIRLDTYDTTYSDSSYGAYIQTTGYKDRGTVYVGGNDGMLHAFKLGVINTTGPFTDNNPYTKAQLAGSSLGSERWAFIPENVLPYLKYISDPNYCHLYTVDLTPYVFDASIGGCGKGSDYADCTKSVSTWKTILIGGMRFGGASACAPACADCTGPPSGTDWVDAPLCVNGKSVGWSEYFALDVTDENNPRLLWEFTSPYLGFATSGPAVVRINAANDPTGNSLNGHWFVVFGSGPTGAIETTNHQFEGRSDQDLRYFIFDLANGPGSGVSMIDTKIADAFSGDLFNSTNDSGLQNGKPDYEDDAVYGGYASKDTNGTWTDGGVGRILTDDSPDLTKWTYSQIINGIGPVTSGVSRLQDNNAGKLWLFFGTGRYYYFDSALGDSKSSHPSNPYGVDDVSSQRRIFGVSDPCYNGAGRTFDSSCPAAISGTSSLLNNATNTSNISTNEDWYIYLDTGPAPCDSNSTDTCGSERVLTTPVTSTGGAVYFTTFKPYDEECGVGGKTYLWGVEYNSGGALAGAMGTALLQLSTGSIQQIDLSKAFTEQGGRRTASFEGMPPTASGLAVFTPPPPLRKMLYIREEK